MQTPVVFAYGEQAPIRQVAAAAHKAGDMFNLGGRFLPVIAACAAGDLMSLATSGAWQVPKPTGVPFAAGAVVCWDPAGSPANGTAASGSAVASATGKAICGFAVEPAAANDTYVETYFTIVAATAAGVV